MHFPYNSGNPGFLTGEPLCGPGRCGMEKYIPGRAVCTGRAERLPGLRRGSGFLESAAGMGKEVAKPDSYLQYPLLSSLSDMFRPHTFLSKTDCKDFF